MQRTPSDLFRKPRLPSGNHGLSKEFVMASQRERLLDAAIEAIAENGYAATTVTSVIDRAGVSSATFYSFFANKEECFIAAHQRALNSLLSAINEQFETVGGEWTDSIVGGLKATIEALGRRPDLARVTLVELMAAGPKAHEQYLLATESFLPFLRKGREVSDHPELIPDGTEEVTLGAISGVVFHQVLEGHADDLDRLLPTLVYTALVPYLGHDRALTEMKRAARA